VLKERLSINSSTSIKSFVQKICSFKFGNENA